MVLAAGLAKLPPGLLLKSIKPLWVIILLTLLIHFFTDPGEVLWHWKFLSLTKEGIIMGVKMSLRLVLLLLVSSLMTFTTSPIVLTDGIESLLRPFRRIGVPAHELAMMMTIALRFIPTLLEETDRIMKAQMSRGADFSSGNLVQRAKNLLPILIPLLFPLSDGPMSSPLPWKRAATMVGRDGPGCMNLFTGNGMALPLPSC